MYQESYISLPHLLTPTRSPCLSLPFLCLSVRLELGHKQSTRSDKRGRALTLFYSLLCRAPCPLPSPPPLNPPLPSCSNYLLSLFIHVLAYRMYMAADLLHSSSSFDTMSSMSCFFVWLSQAFSSPLSLSLSLRHFSLSIIFCLLIKERVAPLNGNHFANLTQGCHNPDDALK